MCLGATNDMKQQAEIFNHEQKLMFYCIFNGFPELAGLYARTSVHAINEFSRRFEREIACQFVQFD